MPKYQIHMLLLFTFISYSLSQHLIISHPPDLAQKFNNSQILSVPSPIGFKPRSGTLHGKLTLAQPLNACIQLPSVPFSEDQDIFMMADDTGCLQSVKAQNIAASGAYLAIIKRNINNTLHDREIDIVHIPVLEIEPSDYLILQDYLKSNVNTTISLLADFTSVTEHSKIVTQLWLSPTQINAYKYILEFKNFLKNQKDKISFYPRFVLHSQTNRKQYIGCLSSGRFCAPELEMQGKPEGAKVVGEALRQIIIANNDSHKWFDYANNYYQKCLKNGMQTLWQQKNSELCSQNAMLSSGIQPQSIFSEYNQSFRGPRQEIDTNFYLQEERQLYLQQQITTFPILFINGKMYKLSQNPQEIMIRICTMIHPDPQKQTQQCQKLTNPPFFTKGEVFIGIGLLIGIMVVIMFGCKLIIKNKMKKEMRGQVDKTLSQYYRYMETLQEPDQVPVPASTYVKEIGNDKKEKDENEEIGSVELTEYKEKVEK